MPPRFHLGPGIEIGLSEDKQGVGWRCPMAPTGSSAAGARSPSRIDLGRWAGAPVPVQQLVIQGMVSRGREFLVVVEEDGVG
jgi:hypothetical protein